MSALSDYLLAHLPEGWTHRDLIAALASDLNPTTVYRYINGKHTPSPPEGVLQAFARVLNVPIVDLRIAAGVAAGEAEPWNPPPEANRLNYAQRTTLDAFIRATAAALDDAAQRAGAGEPVQETAPVTDDAQMQSYVARVRELGQHELADRLEAALGNAGSDIEASCSKDT